jgi:hypothetical protein
MPLYAMTRNCDLGVDLEKVRPLQDMQQIGQKSLPLSAAQLGLWFAQKIELPADLGNCAVWNRRSLR